MFFHKSIPKKADIYKKPKGFFVYKSYYKPLNKLQSIGIVIIVMLILFNVVMILPSQRTNVSSVKEAETANGSWDNNNNHSWDNGNTHWNNNSWENWHNNSENNNSVPVNVTPFPSFSPSNSPVTINPINPEPVQNQFPTSPVTAIVISQPNQPSPQNIDTLSSQIITLQQQIAGQMQGCINNATQMATQVAQMQAQQNKLQSQLNTVNTQQQPSFDTSTPQGQQQNQAWLAQQQQTATNLQNQVNALSTSISNAQTTMNNANNQCQQNVSQLEQNRGTLEQNLDQAFTTGMSNATNIQPPQ